MRIRISRSRRCLVWLTVLGGLVAAPRAQAEADAPEPPAGKWAETVLALLDYNRELCDGIAGRVLTYWRGLDGDSAGQQAVRDFLLERSLSDLAAARAASDIIARLLPGAKRDAGPEIAAILERRAALQTSLCDTVALPTAPREQFAHDVANLLERIDREENELSLLLVVPEDLLQIALDPYLVPIQVAGVEAEGEYLDYLESIKPKPREPTQKELMAAWHAPYARQVAPVRRALARYLAGRRKNDAAQIRDACRQLTSAVIPVLAHPEIFRAPDPAIRQPLFKAYGEIRRVATECVAARFPEADAHLEEAIKLLGVAASRLAPYGLQP